MASWRRRDAIEARLRGKAVCEVPDGRLVVGRPGNKKSENTNELPSRNHCLMRNVDLRRRWRRIPDRMAEIHEVDGGIQRGPPENL